jgi:hypothetical protein
MSDQVIAAIENILDRGERGERVELLKGPGGEVKILRVRREIVPAGKGARRGKE